MSLRGLVVLALLLAALGMAWQMRERLQAALAPAPLVVMAPVEADAAPATPDAASTKPAPSRRGALRKCVRGQQVSYTNVECPAGSREQAVGGAPVNVLPATPVARVAPPPAPGGSAPSSLHQALDLTRDDRLRDRIMERAIDGATR